MKSCVFAGNPGKMIQIALDVFSYRFYQSEPRGATYNFGSWVPQTLFYSIQNFNGLLYDGVGAR